jgi:hypothetical protein
MPDLILQARIGFWRQRQVWPLILAENRSEGICDLA